MKPPAHGRFERVVHSTMSAESKTTVIRRFSFHIQMPVWMYCVLSIPVLIGLAMLFFWREIPLIAPLWCILLPLFGLTDREREINREKGVIISRWKLYGLLLLWQKAEPISNYVAITCRRASSGKGSHMSIFEEEWIALVRPSGKFSYVQYFGAQKNKFCPEAQASAQNLAEATGLPIQNYPHRIFNRRTPETFVTKL